MAERSSMTGTRDGLLLPVALVMNSSSVLLRATKSQSLFIVLLLKSFIPTSLMCRNQLFDIICQSCGTSGNAGSSCTVSPQGDSNTCVQIGQANSPLEIATCDGSDAQLFDIVVIDIFH